MAEPDTEDPVQSAVIFPPEIVRFSSVDVEVDDEYLVDVAPNPVPIPDPYA
jgi:hypothetical protein